VKQEADTSSAHVSSWDVVAIVREVFKKLGLFQVLQVRSVQATRGLAVFPL